MPLFTPYPTLKIEPTKNPVKMRFVKPRPFISSIMLLFILICGIPVAFLYIKNYPAPSTFERIAQSKWESEFQKPNRLYFPSNDLCIKPTFWSGLGKKSNRNSPFVWYQDVSPDHLENDRNTLALKQIKALFNAGILVRQDIGGGITRYSLSEDGWKISNYSHKSFCLVYGKASYLGMKQFRYNKGFVGIDISYGLPNKDSLYGWAKNESIIKLFPEIKNSLDGIKKSYFFRRENLVWVSGRQKSPLLRSVILDLLSIFRNPTPTLPSNEEVERLATTAWDQTGNGWPGHYLELPPAEKFPVDYHGVLSKTGYKVYVYKDPSISKYRNVYSKTLPYLLQLEELGVLQKEVVRGMLTFGERAGEDADAYEFKLTDFYKDKVDPSYPNKFRLGPPTIDLISTESVVYDASIEPILLIHAKFRMTYRKAPAWIAQSGLMDKWPELKNAITKGNACIMLYRYNLVSHKFEGGGSGSCWRAYESMFGL